MTYYCAHCARPTPPYDLYPGHLCPPCYCAISADLDKD